MLGLNIDKNMKLSWEQIKEIARKEKKLHLICNIMLITACVLWLAVVIIAFIFTWGWGIVTSIIFVAGVVLSVYWIIVYKTRSDMEWLANYAIGKEIDIIAIEGEPLEQKNFSDGEFVLSKIVCISSSAMLLIDEVRQQFIYKNGEKYTKAHDFFEVIDYEIFDGYRFVQNAFDGTTQEVCCQLSLIVKLSSFEGAKLVIDCIKKTPQSKSSLAYMTMRNKIQILSSVFDDMIKKQKVLENTFIEEESKSTIAQSSKELLQELKEMLNEGLITQADYDEKKKQILGI